MKLISVHVVDIANGVVARGMRVQVVSLDGDGSGKGETVLEGTVGNNGLVEDLERPDRIPVGNYELRLHVAQYYRDRGTTLPERPFMDVQVFRFGISDGRQHDHLPVKLTPWGMSLFRGA
jgi:5-hydroxyisourate hydrolase